MGDFNGDNYRDKFIGELVNFVAGDKFQTMFESFFLTHATKFTDDEEHKLEYYDLYQTFHGLFDEQLEVFCRNQGMSQTEFMKRCREASVEDEKAKHYIDILLSSVEYDTFVKLMKIMRPVAEMRASVAKSVGSPKPDGKAGAAGVSPAKAASKEEDRGFNDRADSKAVESAATAADVKGGSTRDDKFGSK